MTDVYRIKDMDLAIIGMCSTWDNNILVERVVYDGNAIRNILIEDYNMSWDEAVSFIDHNIVSGYIGPGTPILVWPMEWEEVHEHTKSIRPSRYGQDHLPAKRGSRGASQGDAVEQDRVLRIHAQSGERGSGSGDCEVPPLESGQRLSLVPNASQSCISVSWDQQQRDDAR